VADDDWESQAGNWLRWARTPGHDAYWYYRDGFFDRIVPPPGDATLEIGCGEGRVARDLSARGHRIVALDRAPTLLDAARRADPRGSYLVADAAKLPFPERSFDVVVAYNALMDTEDMPAVVREVGRVLRPGGTFCISVTHPVNDAGRFADASTFVIEHSYLDSRRFEGTFERDGLVMTFFGWTHSVADYVDALEAADLRLTRLREPRPERADEHYEPWHRVPMFLQLQATRTGSQASRVREA
jgi:SAM-dependent methyltransferase